MKIEFIKRGAETRLILIFAGWSTDARFYRDCIADGWDTAVIYDYRDLSMPEIPARYATVYIFAYSLGVWAASRCGIDASLRVAICGTCVPVSDYLGISDKVFYGTANGLNRRNLQKFHRRMAGDRITFDRMTRLLPKDPDIEPLRDELLFIADNGKGEWDTGTRWHRAYVAMQDNIIPTDSQLRFWSEFGDTEIVRMQSPHCADIAYIVRQCVPDCSEIGNGFSRAHESYMKSAVVQAEVCDRIFEKLRNIVGDNGSHVGSLLEIGAGCGMLTDRWSRLLSVESATYIDLSVMPRFAKTEHEEYIVEDAEQWLEKTGRKFDVILSASTIQWFADPVRFISTVRNRLAKGGMAVLSTFVSGNLSELDGMRVSPIVYRKADDYTFAPWIEAERWSRTLTFESAREMLMHLRDTGVTPHSSRKDRKKGSAAFSRPLRMTGLPTRLTYTPMIIVIQAEK